MKQSGNIGWILLVGLMAVGSWGCDSNKKGPSGHDDVGVPGDDGGGTTPARCARTFVYRHGEVDLPAQVSVVGDFPRGDEGISLAHQGGSFFTATVEDLAEGTYLYRYDVDGTTMRDQDNPDRSGESSSVAEHLCPFDPDCLTDADCTSGQATQCRFYLCLTCQCEDGYECDSSGECVPVGECQNDDDCPGTSRCRDSVCGPECLDHGDCSGEQRCNSNGQCIDPQCVQDEDCPNPVTSRCNDSLCVTRPCDERAFLFVAPEVFESVHVAGSFNGWPGSVEDGGLAMRLVDDVTWFAVFQGLDDGTYQYKYVGTRSNGESRWFQDTTNPESVDDGHGGLNSVFHVDCSGSCLHDTDCADDWVCRGAQCVPPPEAGVCGDPDVFDWRDGIMYFVLIDRFHNSDGQSHPVDGASGMEFLGASGQFEGGDLRGVTAKIPYLDQLGVNTLWLSAPYKNRDYAGDAIDPSADQRIYSAYHGYWPSPENINYSDPMNPNPRPRVEGRIGSEADLRQLVTTAHSTDMKVLLDYVMNHVDIDSDLYKANYDWFAREGDRFRLCQTEDLWEDPYWGTRCAFTSYLPPFEFENAAARQWSVRDAIWWAEEFNIDGYRLDAIKHVPKSWLRELRAELNQAFPNPNGGRFYLVGETFTYFDKELLGRYIDPPTMLDGQFDFPMKREVCEAIFRWGDMHNFAQEMIGNDTYYGQNAIMTTWIGNHDVPRPIHWASRQLDNCTEGSTPHNGWTDHFPQPQDAAPYERLAVAFSVLMTSPGIPLIYYGDEVGLAGGGDPDNRRMMPWGNLNSHQIALRDRVSELARIRQENKVLSRGQRQTVAVHSDQGWWVYRMTGCGDEAPDVLVALNRNDEARTMPIPAGSYTNLRTNTTVQGGDHQVPPRDYLLLRQNP